MNTPVVIPYFISLVMHFAFNRCEWHRGIDVPFKWAEFARASTNSFTYKPECSLTQKITWECEDCNVWQSLFISNIIEDAVKGVDEAWIADNQSVYKVEDDPGQKFLRNLRPYTVAASSAS